MDEYNVVSDLCEKPAKSSGEWMEEEKEEKRWVVGTAGQGRHVSKGTFPEGEELALKLKTSVCLVCTQGCQTSGEQGQQQIPRWTQRSRESGATQRITET